VERIAIDPAVLAFAAAAALVACVIAGRFPAWQARSADLVNGLKDIGAPESQRSRKMLVMAEVAVVGGAAFGSGIAD